MNKRQKITLWIGVIIFVLMGLFPPFSLSKPELNRKANITEQPDFSVPAYGFLFSPPERYLRADFRYVEVNTRLNFIVLFIQWAIVSILTFAVIKTLPNPKMI